MRVLLIPARITYPHKEPCLDLIAQALPYIAGTLKVHGHDVSALNLNLWDQPGKDSLKRAMKKAIAENQPDIIGISGLSADYLFCRDALDIAREVAPHTPTILGGGLITADTIYIFNNLRPDFAVIDEGEETIADLLNCMQTGGNYGAVKGIMYWKDGGSIMTPERGVIKEIDKIALPHYEPFDIESFFALSNQKDNYFYARTQNHPRIMPISAARSCPYPCTFCWVGKQVYRKRSVESLIDEIKLFHDKYQFNILKIYDNLFSVNRERLQHFSQEMKKLNLGIDWACTMRVDDVDLDILKEMKDAGCMHVEYGFESASPTILESMRKKISVEDIGKAFEWSEEVGIGAQGNFIFGDMAETIETAQETLDFYHKYCKDHIVHLDYISPYPSTKLFKVCFDEGGLMDKKNYYESMYLRPRINMTKMTYREFYGATYGAVRNGYIGFKPAKVVSWENKGSFIQNKITTPIV